MSNYCWVHHWPGNAKTEIGRSDAYWGKLGNVGFSQIAQADSHQCNQARSYLNKNGETELRQRHLLFMSVFCANQKDAQWKPTQSGGGILSRSLVATRLVNKTLSPITYRLSPVACRQLPFANCLSPIVYRLSPIAYCLSPIAYGPSTIDYRLSPIVYIAYLGTANFLCFLRNFVLLPVRSQSN